MHSVLYWLVIPELLWLKTVRQQMLTLPLLLLLSSTEAQGQLACPSSNFCGPLLWEKTVRGEPKALSPAACTVLSHQSSDSADKRVRVCWSWAGCCNTSHLTQRMILVGANQVLRGPGSDETACCTTAVITKGKKNKSRNGQQHSKKSF